MTAIFSIFFNAYVNWAPTNMLTDMNHLIPKRLARLGAMMPENRKALTQTLNFGLAEVNAWPCQSESTSYLDSFWLMNTTTILGHEWKYIKYIP